MKKLTMFACFFLISQLVESQCDTEFCRIINDLKVKYEAIKSENFELNRKISTQKSEIAQLKRAMLGLQIENDSLKVEIAKLNAKNSQDKELINTTNKLIEHYKSAISIKGIEIEKQKNELERLRQDSIQNIKKELLFKSKNLIFDDGYAIPYNLPLGPITFSRESGYPLEPTESQSTFFRHLSEIKSVQEFEINIVINAPGTRREKVSRSIKEQIEQFCPNCEVHADYDDYEPGSKWEVTLICFIKKT